MNGSKVFIMDKKKKLLICLIINVILLFIACGIIFFQKQRNNLEKKSIEEERINSVININNVYGNYTFGNKVECDNELCNYLNYTLDIHKKLNEYNISSIKLNDIIDLNESLEKLKLIKNDISNLDYDNINKYISIFNKYEKEAFLEIYNDSVITKSVNDDKEIQKSLLKQLSNNLQILEYLSQNDDNFISTNNSIIYLNEDFRNEFTKFNLDIPMVSVEQAYGKRIPILMYHGVDDNIWGNTSLFVIPSNFEKQMDYLVENGYTTLFLSEIGNAVNYEKPVIITFDDGYLDMFTIAYPIMKARNIKSNMYIITNWLDGNIYMTPKMVKSLSDSGLVEIGSHTLNHVHLNKLSYSEQETELIESKKFLEELLGKEVNTIAYPYGQRNIDTLNITKQYYKFAVTTESGANYSKTCNGLSLILKRYNMQRTTSFETFKRFVESNML